MVGTLACAMTCTFHEQFRRVTDGTQTITGGGAAVGGSL